MSSVGKIYMIPSLLAPDSVDRALPKEVAEVINRLNDFAVENERSARRFIRVVDKEKVIDEINFHILDKNTSGDSLDELLMCVYEGRDLGIISEAGCPGIADPGARLVEKAHESGIKVVPLVGPSSILLALMASGMNGQSFAFHGYLPIKDHERKRAVKQLESEAIKLDRTQIFMETPYRNHKLLDELLKTCAPKTRLCIAANITAQDEYIETMTIGEWKKMKIDIHKKPTIFVLGK